MGESKMTAATTAKGAEARKEARYPARMAAQIIMPKHLTPADCVVREVSMSGVRIDVDENWILPRVFWLRIEGDPKLNHCRLVWRKGRKAGLEYFQAKEGEKLTPSWIGI